ncbi:conserved protein of unknown function [Methylorubrum extorquens]|uniref:Uncharacterized protein n=1 Tax=Methylorubrum extorquens TaxID=408 RepID=A0A2N9ATQ9_METEX|nr:conserved protein of unknown function [Methylorubrum extorquens]
MAARRTANPGVPSTRSPPPCYTGAAYVTSLQADLAGARAEALTAKADAAGKAAAIAAPASSDDPVAPVLRDALEGLSP